jgi:hypothetical protein
MRSALRLLKMTLPVLCTIAVVGAQAPAPDAPGAQQPNSPPAAPATQAAQPGKVTYTGCLKPGAMAESWTLENAVISSVGASAKAEGAYSTPQGATATSGKAPSNTTLALTVKPTDNLKPHTNHKIEVVGTVSATDASAKTPGAAAPGAGASAASTAPRQNFNVESFKMVSATCP